MNGKIIEINEDKVKDHLGKFVRDTVEDSIVLIDLLTMFFDHRFQRAQRASIVPDVGLSYT